MKIVLILAVVVAVAIAEPCQDNMDCSNHGITMCGNSYHVVCDNNQCQCTNGPTGTQCTGRDDCNNDCHHGTHRHCVDGMCQCTRQ